MKASIIAIVAVFLIYITVACVAIFSFGDDIEADIMENISGGDNNDGYDYTLMAMFMIISAMHIPIVFFIGKEAVLIIVDELMRRTISRTKIAEEESLTESIDEDDNGHANGDGNPLKSRKTIDDVIAKSIASAQGILTGPIADNDLPEYLSMHPLVYYITSTLVYALVVVLACVLGDISVVFGIIGSTACTFIVFFAPAGFLLRGA
jgi:amino acid permease